MKVFSKVAVILAAFMLVSVFTACNNNEDASASEVAVFVNQDATCTFYDDDTWAIEGKMELGDTSDDIPVEANGTYNGDVTKDGEVDIEVETYSINGQELPIPGGQNKGTITIKDDKFNFIFGTWTRKAK